MSTEEAREHLSKEQIFEFQQAFDIFDQDGGGDISTRELGRVMKLLGQNPTPEELDKIIEEVDVDGSGTIDFNEFLIMMVMQIAEEGQAASEDELKAMFHYIDKNKDNVIDFEELCWALDGVPADPPVVNWEIEELFNEADRNKDGKIDIDEWCQWMDDVKTH